MHESVGLVAYRVGLGHAPQGCMLLNLMPDVAQPDAVAGQVQ